MPSLRQLRNTWDERCRRNEKHVNDFGSDNSSIWEKPTKDFANGIPKNTPKITSSIKPNAKENQEVPSLGIDPVVKTLYEKDGSTEGRMLWEPTPPRMISKRQADKDARVSMKLYKAKDHTKPVVSGCYSLRNFMLEIQNPALVAALQPIMEKEEVYLHVSEAAKFKEPFAPLYFRSEEIAALHRATKESDPLKQQLLLLLKVMAELFGTTRSAVAKLQESKLINYKNAWAYFPKHSVLYSPGRDCERLYRTVSTRYEHSPKPKMVLTAQGITFDGRGFVWSESEFEMAAFEGNKPINELEAYPLQYHEDAENIKKRMDARGKKVLNYQGLEYCMYTGMALHQTQQGMEKHNVDCRVLIDTYGYKKHHLALNRIGGKDTDTVKERIVRKSKKQQKKKVSRPLATPPTTDDDELDELLWDLPVPRTEPPTEENMYIQRLSPEDQEENRQIMLEYAEDIIFVSPMLHGYALHNKLWVLLYVDDVRPVLWNDDAYGHLVYPEEQKDLVLSFVENHQRTRVSGLEMNDVIRGKGQGLILLLSGPPGTGKTLTAEAVADKTRRPLFYLQAEDLGLNAITLGANLKKVFSMATEWDAVILLDEADVFMAERNPVDIARNELVSIFLRELEYFRGIIFLTTNLYSTIDTAFRSRVNIHLRFEPLAPEAREVLWRKFLDRLPPMKKQAVEDVNEVDEDAESNTPTSKVVRAADSLSDEDLRELSMWELNGREIKNAIKTVKSWCDAKGYEMTLGRLESGIKVTAPNSSKRGDADTSLYD